MTLSQIILLQYPLLIVGLCVWAYFFWRFIFLKLEDPNKSFDILFLVGIIAFILGRVGGLFVEGVSLASFFRVWDSSFVWFPVFLVPLLTLLVFFPRSATKWKNHNLFLFFGEALILPLVLLRLAIVVIEQWPQDYLLFYSAMSAGILLSFVLMFIGGRLHMIWLGVESNICLLALALIGLVYFTPILSVGEKWVNVGLIIAGTGVILVRLWYITKHRSIRRIEHMELEP